MQTNWKKWQTNKKNLKKKLKIEKKGAKTMKKVRKTGKKSAKNWEKIAKELKKLQKNSFKLQIWKTSVRKMQKNFLNANNLEKGVKMWKKASNDEKLFSICHLSSKKL